MVWQKLTPQNTARQKSSPPTIGSAYLHPAKKNIIFAAYVFQSHHLVISHASQPSAGWPVAAPSALKIPHTPAVPKPVIFEI
jgi:hypothetical protein